MRKLILCLLLLMTCVPIGFAQGKVIRPSKPQNNHISENHKPGMLTVDEIKYVDLGLPSNTFWANKNLGADKISDKGEFLEWAQTNLIEGNIPTKEQFLELKNLCQWNWTTMNGVEGYKIVGPNGNFIFLPSTANHGSARYLLENGGYTDFVDKTAYWSHTPHATLSQNIWILTISKYENTISYTNWMTESNSERKCSLRLIKD